MTLTIDLNSRADSQYWSYFKANYGNIFYRDAGIFTLPSFLYTYVLYKRKIKFKGVRKISIEFSEFEEGVLVSPSKILGPILVYNCQFDFEKLKSIDSRKDQQLFVLVRMHEAILRIADIYKWEKTGFIEVYDQVYDRIVNDTVPADFWDVRI